MEASVSVMTPDSGDPKQAPARFSPVERAAPSPQPPKIRCGKSHSHSRSTACRACEPILPRLHYRDFNCTESSSIIIVPDIGPKPNPATRRLVNLGAWLYEVYPESQIWEFEYDLSENGPPVWTGLLQRSEELLEILLIFATNVKVCSAWRKFEC